MVVPDTLQSLSMARPSLLIVGVLQYDAHARWVLCPTRGSSLFSGKAWGHGISGDKNILKSATSGKAGGLKKVEPLKAVDVVNRSKRFGCEPPTGGPAYHRSI